MVIIIISSIIILFILIYAFALIIGLRKSQKNLYKMLEDSNTSANENFKKLNAELKELNSFIIDSNKSIETNFNERMNSKSQAMSSRLQQMNDTIKNLNANKGANIHKTNSKLEDDVSSLKSQIKLNENNLKELNKKIRK